MPDSTEKERRPRKHKKNLKEDIQALRNQLETVRAHITHLQNTITTQKGKNIHSLQAEANSANRDRVVTNLRQRKILRGHYGKIYAMQWQPHTHPCNDDTANHLVSASQDGKLIVWNGRTTNKLRMIPLKSSWVMTCAYSPSGEAVACGGLDNLCTVFNLNDESANSADAVPNNKELRSHEGYLSSCRFLNNQQIITASGDSTCILWDIEHSKPVTSYDAHASDVMSVSILYPYETFVSGSCDTTARVFTVNEKECKGTFTGHEADINTVEWFPDGNAFASGSDDSTLALYDKRAYRRLNKYWNNDFLSGVTSLCWSLSGKLLFAGYDEAPFAVVWDTCTAQHTQILSTQITKRVSCVGLQCNGHAVCTGSWDYNLRIWA